MLVRDGRIAAVGDGLGGLARSSGALAGVGVLDAVGRGSSDEAERTVGAAVRELAAGCPVVRGFALVEKSLTPANMTIRSSPGLALAVLLAATLAGCGNSTASGDSPLASSAASGNVPTAPTTYEGALRPGDATLSDGEYVDDYTVHVEAGQTVEADLTASGFDPYLIVVGPSGAQEDNDDHEGSTSRSHVRLEAAESGSYTVRVTSYAEDEAGEYRLAVAVGGGGAALAGERVAAARQAPGSGLPPGTYDCWGTLATYIGTTTSGSVSYPNYSYATSHLGEFALGADGTYRVDGDANGYAYDEATGIVTWHGGTYAGRESRYALNGEGVPTVTISSGNTKWECKRV